MEFFYDSELLKKWNYCSIEGIFRKYSPQLKHINLSLPIKFTICTLPLSPPLRTRTTLHTPSILMQMMEGLLPLGKRYFTVTGFKMLSHTFLLIEKGRQNTLCNDERPSAVRLIHNYWLYVVQPAQSLLRNHQGAFSLFTF